MYRRIRRTRSFSTPTASGGSKHEVVEEQSLDETLHLSCRRCGWDPPASDTKSKKGIIGSQPRGTTMCSLIARKTPIVKSVIWQKQREPGSDLNLRSAWMGLHLLRNFGDMVTADHKFGAWKKSRDADTKTLLSCKMILQIGFRVIRWKTKDTSETKSCLQRFLSPPQKPEILYTDTSKEFIEACQDIYKGIMTQAPFIAQKPTGWQKEPSVEWKKEHLSHKCKADFQHSCGTVRWRTPDLCATCTTS